MLNSLSRSTPESVGIRSEVILNTIAELKKLDSLNSIMILRHGHVCAEAWWKPYSPAIPHMLYSLSKSFVSSAIGLLRAEGKLALTDKLISFFPEYDSCICDPKMRDVTLKHLLTMSSGHRECAMGGMQSREDGDYVKGFLSSGLPHKPGEKFVYNSAATYMLASVVRKISGENVREYLTPRLFEPLGITPGIWECCPKGTNLGGWGFNLKTEDLAKFAQLLLDGGKLEGRQILPADYIREASSPQIDNSTNTTPDWKCGYGYHFWISQHGFRGDGACGQYAIVLPEYDMALAITSGLHNMQQVLTVLWDHLLAGIDAEADTIPENPEALGNLKSELESLSIPYVKGNLTRRCAPFTWSLAENAYGIRTVRFHCGEKQCSLEFDTVRGPETISAGFGFIRDNLVQFQDTLPRRGAADAAWLPDGRLQIQICFYETPFRDIWFLDPEKKTIECKPGITFLHPEPGPLTVL